MKWSTSYLCRSLSLASALALASCGDSTSSKPEPKTPEEMYARADAVLKPNAENDASDFNQAIAWLKKAAEAGYLKAQTDLGGLYFGGGVVKEDWDEAYRWFSMAADQGNAAAHHFLAIILDKGTKCMAADSKKAWEHWKLAAEAKIPHAMYRVGHEMMLDANHLSEGLSYMEKAAEAGVADAASELGFLYTSGSQLVSKDADKSLHWFKRAADLGEPRALYIIARRYQAGVGLPQDADKALAAFRLSAGQGFVPSMQSLVTILSFGEATPEMRKEAQQWQQRIDAYEAAMMKDAKEAGHDAVEAVEQAPVTPMLVP
ncbi:MAG: tetratricopeptide repeat protein [Akkermansia sp.]